MGRKLVLLGCILLLSACGLDPANGTPVHVTGEKTPSGAGGATSHKPEAAPFVTGTKLADGHADVAGVTSSDDVVALGQDLGAIVVPSSGGAPIVVDEAADFVNVRGRVVAAFHNADLVTGIADLSIWTMEHGTVPFATDAIFFVAATDDGSRVLATQGSSSDGSSTDLVLGTPDGSAPTVLRTVSRGTGCTPFARFVEGLFVLFYCDALSTSRAIATVDPAGGAITDLVTDAGSFYVLPQSSTVPAQLLTLSPAGDVATLPLAGGPATPLASGADSFALLPDYSAVLLRSGGAVRRVPLDGGPATELVADGVRTIRSVSPDGQWMMLSSELGPRHGYGDLLVASTVDAGSPSTLTKALDAAVFGSAFTADSSRALYFTAANDLGTGTLESAPVEGGAATVHGTDAWVVDSYAGSRIVFNDDYVPVAKRPGRATLRTADVNSSDEPAIIATHAGSSFALSSSLDRVFFSYDDGTSESGLYVATLP